MFLGVQGREIGCSCSRRTLNQIHDISIFWPMPTIYVNSKLAIKIFIDLSSDTNLCNKTK